MEGQCKQSGERGWWGGARLGQVQVRLGRTGWGGQQAEMMGPPSKGQDAWAPMDCRQGRARIHVARGGQLGAGLPEGQTVGCDTDLSGY